MGDSVFHFGSCELHVGKREIRVKGRLRSVEPLAFDLLVDLIRNRDRVVSKDELLDRVWLGKIVAVGSLARAVMVVRMAISDCSESPVIRTVHRVGYRFVGDVTERRAEPSRAPLPNEGAQVSVALLPAENITGNASLDWMTVGLMSLVNNALAMHPRLAPLSMHGTLATLRGLPADASAEQRAEALVRGNGVSQIVHTCIFREQNGYRLDYRLMSSQHCNGGTVRAENPVRLGRALAQSLLVHLVQDKAGVKDAFVARDPWAIEVFARAIQAWADHNPRRGIKLLRVVLDIEPDHTEAQRLLECFDRSDWLQLKGGSRQLLNTDNLQ